MAIADPSAHIGDGAVGRVPPLAVDRFRRGAVRDNVDGPAVTDPTLAALIRENAYLKLRNAQLQEDVTALAAEGERLTQILERLHGRSGAVGSGPLGGSR
jgi:hypothetical protein